ncbi:MAG: hypothetical protein REH83_05005 [Rickettsiella sp.]|nr:hypothetical protein [Rickettsiella sp.]
MAKESVEIMMRASFNKITKQNQFDLRKKSNKLSKLAKALVIPKTKIYDGNTFLAASTYQAILFKSQQLNLPKLKAHTKMSYPLLAFYVAIAYAKGKGNNSGIADKIKKNFSLIQKRADTIFANTNAENKQQLIETEAKLLQDLPQGYLKIRRHFIVDNELNEDKTSEMFNRWLWLIAITQFLGKKAENYKKNYIITNIEVLLTSDHAFYKTNDSDHLPNNSDGPTPSGIADIINEHGASSDPAIDELEKFLQITTCTNERQISSSQQLTSRYADQLSSCGLFNAPKESNVSAKIEENDVYNECMKYKF